MNLRSRLLRWRPSSRTIDLYQTISSNDHARCEGAILGLWSAQPRDGSGSYPTSGFEARAPAVFGIRIASEGDVVTGCRTSPRSPTARASPATARSACLEALLRAHVTPSVRSGFHRPQALRVGHRRVPRASARHRKGHVHAPDLAPVPDHDRVRIHVDPFRLASASVVPRR